MPKPSPFTRKNGSIGWRVRYRLDPWANPTCETFDTVKSAQWFCDLVDQVGGRAAREARDAALYGEKTRTTAEVFEELIERKTGIVQPDTIEKYRRLWEHHIEPTFGNYPVKAITRGMVEKWVSRLAVTETALSVKHRASDPAVEPLFLTTKTIKNIQGLLSTILDMEYRNGGILTNPAARVALPRTGKRSKPMFLSHSEFAVLLAAVPSVWQGFVALLAGTGLRFSEASALTVADVQLDGAVPTVTVDKAHKRGGVVGVPKTDYAYRSVSLPPNLVPLMIELTQGRARSELVFTRPNGAPVTESWFYSAVWIGVVDKADLGARPRIHDLRHTHASWLIQQGIPLTVIQRRLGHSSITVTSDTYGHIQPDVWAQTAQATAVAMSQALPQIEG